MLDSIAEMPRGSVHAEPLQERPDIGNLIGSLGRTSFARELVRCVYEMYAADNVFVFRQTNERPEVIISESHDGSCAAGRQCRLYIEEGVRRFDPGVTGAMSNVSSRARLIYLDAGRPETSELGEFYDHEGMSDRLLACGRGPDGGALGLSIVRSKRCGPFSGEHDEWLIGVLFPLVVKHCELHWESKRARNAMTSLDHIEKHLALAPIKIPRREAQVIARTLYGMTATGIGLELEISRETVITYRKSVYRRLEIAGFRKLLLWYLKLHDDVGRQLLERPRPNA